MKITINGSHAEKLQLALDEAQKGARARTLTVTRIEEILAETESYLQIPKKALKGCSIHYMDRTNARFDYGSAESTHFLAVYNGRFWAIEKIFRGGCGNWNYTALINLTDEAKAALAARFSKM